MTEKITDNFLIELAKLCLMSKDTTAVVKQHLSYSFIRQKEHKEMFEYIFNYYGAHEKVPTIGMLGQHLPQTTEILNIIQQLREADVRDSSDQIIQTFESYIKKARFQKAWIDSQELYRKQEHEKAMQLIMEESIAVNQFSLKNQLHSRVFADFDSRQMHRKGRDLSVKKIPTGIPALDHHTHGGPEKKTSLLGLARSGVGKSTLLRQLGFSAAFNGHNVVHFQAEGSKEEVEDAYDAMWTGVPIFDIKRGELKGKDLELIDRARRAFLAQCGEIYVIAFEQFDTASVAQARKHLKELEKSGVKIDLALFDYLELFDPGDGKRYSTNAEGERARKGAVAKKITNIATEFDMLTATMTQASDIPFKDWNDPNYVITRNDIANLKATVDPFSYFITLNQTQDENDNDIIRIHEDKLRHYKIRSWESTFHIAQKREFGRFIDHGETIKRFWDPIKKVVIKNAPKTK